MKRADTPHGGEGHRPADALPPSGFELRLANGRAFVEAGARPVGEGFSVRRFSMEIPAVRFPFDVTGGADRFRDQRCVLSDLELLVEATALNQWIAAALDLAPLGIESLQAALRPGGVELYGDHAAAGPFTAKVGIEAEGTGLSLLLYELRLYRPAPLCSALLLHRLAVSARGEEDPLAPLPGAVTAGPLGSATVRCDPLPAVLRQLLVGRGYKLPDARALRLASIDLGTGHAALAFRPGGAPSPAGLDHLTALEGERTYAEVERLVAEGELSRARSELLSLSATGPPHPFAAERLLQLLAADPEAHDLALDVCALWSGRDPPFLAALWVEATVREAQGDLRRAASLFCDLADRTLAVRELFSAAAAAGAAARLAMAAKDDALAQRALGLQQAARPEDLEVLADVAEVAERRGDLPTALSALRRVAAFGGEGEQAALAHARLGRLLLRESRDLPRARLHLDRALQLRPNDRESLLALADACESGGEELRALRLLDRARGFAERDGSWTAAARLALREARLWEEKIRHPENALLRYRDALRSASSAGTDESLFLEVAEGMAGLCERLGLWTEALEAHLAVAERAPPGRRRAEGRLALSRILSERLSDLAAADRSARQALDEDPTFAAAAEELCRLRRDGPPGPYAEALALAAGLAESPVLLAELGRVQLEQLGDVAAASASFEAALARDPTLAAAVEGGVRAAEALGDTAALARALDRLAVSLPPGAERNRALRRLADALEAVGDLDGAADALLDAVGEDESLELLERLLSLHRRRGDAAAAADLARRLAEALSAKGDSAGALAALAAQIEPALSASPELAERLLGIARRLAPEEPRVLRWDVALARRRGDPAGTRSALLELLASGAGEAVERAADFRQLAEACAVLGRLDEAAQAFEQSLELASSEVAAERLVALYGQLERPLARAGALERLAELLVAEGRPAAPQWLEAAEAFRQAEPERAARDLGRAAAAGGDLVPAALRALADLERELGHPAQAAAALERWADVQPDGRSRARALREAAEAGEDASQVERLARLAAEADREDAWSAPLIAAFELESGTADEALEAAERALWLVDLDPTARAICEAVAAAAARRVGAGERELSHLESLIVREPEEVEWLRRRAELLAGQPGETEALERLASRQRGPEAAETLSLLGERQLAAGGLDEAAEAFSMALVHDPESRRALTGALRAVPREPVERRIDLLRRYLERVAPDALEQSAELAELLEPSDPEGALLRWERVAGADPGNLLAAERRAALLSRLDRPAEAGAARVDLAARLRERGEGAANEQELRAALAFLQAGEFVAAAAAAERGLVGAERRLAATLWRALAQARASLGDGAGEAAALGEAAARLPLAEAAPLQRRRAELLLGLGDREGERDALLAALAATPRDVELLRKLQAACVASDDVEGACDALDTLVQASLPDRPAAAAVALELGTLAESRLGRGGRAEAAYRRASALDPSRPEPLQRLGELRLAAGDAEEGFELLARAVALEPDPARAADARVALGLRAAQEMPDGELALAQARAALDLAPGHLGARRLAGDLLYLAGATAEALPILEALAAEPWDDEPELAERYGLFLADARVSAGDAAGAREALAALVDRRPGCEVARERLADLCADLPDAEAAERWIELADGAASARLRSALLVRAGRRLLAADPGLSAALLQRALAEEDAPALRAELRAALEAAGDFEALSDAWVEEAERAREVGDAEAREGALRALAAERRRAEDPEGRALVLDELAELIAPSRRAEAAELLTEAGGLWEGERNAAQALEDWQRALELGAGAGVRSRAISLCRETGRQGDLAALLEQNLSALPDEGGAEALLELADLYAGPLAAPERVEPALREALRLAPDLAGAEERLSSLLRREGRRAELGPFLLARAERAEKAGRDEEAGRLFAAAGDELLAAGDGAGAATALAASARHLPTPERLLKAADLRFEAGDAAGAGELYGRLLEQAPAEAPPRALERRAAALRLRGDAEELARFLERGADAGPAPAAWWAEAASIWEAIEDAATGQAREVAGAARRRCERRAFETDPSDPTLFAAVVGSLGGGDPEEWARLLLLRAAAVPGEAPSLQRTLGEVYWSSGRLDEAGAAYQAALEAEPEDVLALTGLAEVAFAKGEPLEDLGRRLAASLRDAPVQRPEHAEAAFRMGSLLSQAGSFELATELLERTVALAPWSQHTQEALGLLDEAATARGDLTRQRDVRRRRWQAARGEARKALLPALLEVLSDADPAAPEALAEAFAAAPSADVGERLVGALRHVGEWAALAALLERLADLDGDDAPTAERRQGLLLEAADLRGRRLADLEGATPLRERALDLGRGTPTLLRRWLGASEGAPPELIDRALEALAGCVEPEEAGKVRLERAHLAEQRLGPEARRRAWDAVLAGGPLAPGREEALERRLELERGGGLPGPAIQTLLELAELAADPAGAAGRLQQAARIAEEELADPGRAIELLERAAEEAGDARSYTLLAEACDRAGRTEQAAAAMTLEVARREPGERLRERQRKLGLLLVQDLDRPAEALAHLRAAWDGGGTDRKLVEALVRCAAAAGDGELELAALGALPADAPDAPEVARRQAALLEKLGRPAEAADAWRRAFLLRPEDGAAFDALVRQLETRKRWAELAEILQRRAEALVSLGEESRDARAELLFRRGALLAGEIGDAAAAEAAYREVLAQLPGHRAALTALTALCQARGATAEAAALLETDLSGGGAPATVAALGLRLGRLRQEMGDGPAAERALKAALEAARTADLKPLVGEVQGVLAGTLLALDRSEEALVCAKAALAAAPPEEQPRLRGLCAEAAARLGFADQAREHWRELLILRPGDPAGLAGLEALARTEGPGLLAEVLAERAKAEPEPLRRAKIWVELADLCAGKLGDPKGAEAALRAAIEAAPDEAEALERLRKLLEGEERFEEVVELLRQRARKAGSDDVRAGAFRDQGEILRTRLRNPRRAVEAYTRALELRPADAVASEGLGECLLALGQGERAAEHYRRALTGGSHLGEFFLHFRLGEIAQRAGRAEQALQHFQASIAANPAFVPSREAAAQIADALGRVDVAVSILRGLLSALDPAEFGEQVASVLLRIGELEKRSLRFEAAIEAFERSAKLNPKDPRPLQDLAVLYQHRARWADAARVLLELADLREGAAAAAALVEAAILHLDKLADMAKAAELLERAVGFEPPEPRALQRLAEICAALGRQERLVEVADRLHATEGATWPAWLDELWVPIALAYEKAGRLREAHEAIVRARRSAPTAEALLERQRALAEKSGDVGEQIDLEEQLIELATAERPLEAATRLRALARRSVEQLGSPDRAERLLERADELAPGRPEDRRLLADLRRRRPESAGKAMAAYLDLARQSWPPTADLLRALGATAAAVGEPDVARSALGLAGAMAGEVPPPPPPLRPLPERVWQEPPLSPESPFAALLARLAAYLEPLFPGDLRRFGLAPADRLGADRAPQIQLWIEEARAAVRAREVQVFLVPGLDSLALENTRPAAIIVGGGPLASLGPGPMRFLIAQRLALLELGFTLPSKFSPRDAATLALLLACFLDSPGHAPQGEAVRLQPFLAALERACPAEVRSRLAPLGRELARGLPTFDSRRAMADATLRAAKLALWATGDLQGALAALPFAEPAEGRRSLAPWETPLGQALARWAFSMEYLSLRGSGTGP
ncbi:MAG TPA: tetratricopeptide repeat protein [Myxococcales bacterium]|nr:tetratricopeptide repeat protein [Myxococcales bacterium]